ncbi:hypothetical protein ABFS83_13G143300 [Erythranthe nasuta]
MAKQIPTPSLFLLLLLAFQWVMLIVPGEASLCETPSRYFNGICFSRRNCGAICEKEGFSSGRCKAFKCVCGKDCNAAGGGGGGDPGLGPPVEGPPDQGPPEEGPPGEGPPGEGPPGEGPPAGDLPPVRKI